jgi:predicted nuclease of predicted toxin-antitoxin system
MLRLLIDENFNYRILRGLKSRLLQLDLISVRQIGLVGAKDPTLLRWAAQNDRTMLTHDRKTMSAYAEQLLHRAEPMAGVIIVPKKMAIGRAIEDLELIIACHSQEEFRDRIEYLAL